MKIAHMISSAGFYGAEQMVLTLALQQQKQGYEVMLCVFENSDNPHLEIFRTAKENNLSAHVFPCKGKCDMRTLRTLRAFIRKNRFEIIHSHGYKSNFYAFFAGFGLQTKLVTTAHTWYSTNSKMKIYEFIDKKIIRFFDAVIAVSQPLLDEIIRSGVAQDKVSFIRNGIDVNRFRKSENKDMFKREFNLRNLWPLLGVIARLAEDKGHSYLFTVIAKLRISYPDLRLIVVGGGPLKDELEKKVSSSGLQKHVIFTGIRKDIPVILKALDIFVLPSLKEGLPIALLEAMAAEKPVVATSVGAIPSVISDGKNGVLAEPGDSESLYAALSNLLSDKEKCRIYAQAARKKVVEEFSDENMTKEYLSLYDKLMQESGCRE